MKTQNLSLVLILLLLFFYSCDDVFEEDISNEVIQLNSPQNESSIESNVISLIWERNSLVDSYRVQLREEDGAVLMDSLISDTSFSFPLSEGSYKWRVRGENFAYVTNYTEEYSFQITQTDNLSNQVIFLNSPNENAYFKSEMIEMNWDLLVNAETYSFGLMKTENAQDLTLINEEGILSNTYIVDSIVIDEEGEYEWSVIGENAVSQTNLVSRVFFVDNTDPNPVLLDTPMDEAINETANASFTFNWLLPQDIGVIQSPITRSLQVAIDSDFNDIIVSEEIVDDTYTNQISVEGQYWWRILSNDEAGNQSTSEIRTFTLE